MLKSQETAQSLEPTVPGRVIEADEQRPGGAPADSAIPIVVGVTGHRDLRPDDIPKLEVAVEKIFKDLQAQYPDTPLLVLSPLAEGADRLVADVALKCQARLVVPLPLPRSEYEKDFATEESRAEFGRLLDRAWTCFELPLVVGNTPESIQIYGPNRDKQYAQVGAYIARHSQVLIALWDGTETDLVGGTWQIVKFKRGGVPEPYAPPGNPLDIVDTGPVYHIVTPREKNPLPADEPFALRKKFPEGWESIESADSAESFEPAHILILNHMNAFNCDVKRLSQELEEEIKQSKEGLIPATKISMLSETACVILDQYAVADMLAIHFQKRRRWTLMALFIIAVAAVLSFEVYAHLLRHPLVLALYPIFLGLAVFIHRRAKREDFQNKHLDYRALAEGLRVQLFWNIAGLPDEVSDHYLRQHRTELEWIRNAIRSWNVPAVHSCGVAGSVEESVAAPDRVPLLKELVHDHWVEKQRQFFSKNTARDRGKLERHDRWVKWLFVLGLALAILVVVLDWVLHESGGYLRWHHWLIVAMGTAPAIAAAMEGYAEKLAFSAQAKRYQWMSALFTRASAQLQKLLSPDQLGEAQQLIRELGKEALEENGDWVIIHRGRPMKVPRG